MSQKKRQARGPLSKTTKPWGSEELLACTEFYALKRITVKKGSRPSLQYHRRKTETLFLLSGRLRLEVGDKKGAVEADDLSPGECIDIPRGKIHRVFALEDSVLIEVSTPELDDVVRIEDDYGRDKG